MRPTTDEWLCATDRHGQGISKWRHRHSWANDKINKQIIFIYTSGKIDVCMSMSYIYHITHLTQNI